MNREEWQNSRKTAFLERVDKAIECIQRSPNPIFADQLASQVGVSYAVINKYINHDIPKRLDENHELVVKRCGSKRTYQIIDKRDRYPITKTESGYPDPTAAKALVSVMHSKPFGDYVPGTVWPIRVGNYARTLLVIGCEPETPLKTAYFLYGVEAFTKEEAERRNIDLADARIVPISETLYADTKFIFTRHSKYVIRWDKEFRYIRISKEKFDIVKGMIGQHMLMNAEAPLTCEHEKLKQERVDHDTEVYALKAKIKRLEAKYSQAKTLIENMYGNTAADLSKHDSDVAHLKGKIEAYELIFDKLQPGTLLQATTRASEDLLARRTLQKLTGLKSNNLWELSRAVIFGDNKEGDKMRDTTRVKDPIFEAVKAWGQEHPDVVVQMEYDAPNMKIRFRMTWLPNSTFITEHDVDFIVYDQRRSSDQATAEFTFNVLDKMYKEGGYGHE